MLPLDSKQWAELHHAYGSGADIPALLIKLQAHRDPASPAYDDVWEDIWGILCHQGVVGSASYAAVPYIIEVAATQPPQQRFDYLHFVGDVEIYRIIGPDSSIPDFVQPSYFAAHEQAIMLILECLHGDWPDYELQILLGTLPILKGKHPLGAAIVRLYKETTCPNCSTKFPPDGYSWFREFQRVDPGIQEFTLHTSAYTAWITDNPLGFICILPADLPVQQMIVHRSGCPKIEVSADHTAGAKVICMPDKKRLWTWRWKHDIDPRHTMADCDVCGLNM
ncbi:MAG: hypothetical protein M3R24_27390 [Chloroflexota bacterium]|nr:hypothetical protein [Chloroflexota bacterium]